MSSAVLAQMKGLGFLFHSLIHLRMSASNIAEGTRWARDAFTNATTALRLTS